MTQAEYRRTFAPLAASAREARRFVEAVLAEARLGHLCYVSTMLVGELVANAILHTGTQFDVVVRPGLDRARVEVHDGSPQLPIRKHYSSLSGTGRGLLLVEEMSAGWGSAATPQGKVVWFEVDGQGAPAFDILGAEAL